MLLSERSLRHVFFGEAAAASGVMSHARVTGGGSAGAPPERVEEGEDDMTGEAEATRKEGAVPL